MPEQQIEVVNQDTLPCGCVLTSLLVDGHKTMTYDPCDEECEFYLYTMGETLMVPKVFVEEGDEFPDISSYVRDEGSQ